MGAQRRSCSNFYGWAIHHLGTDRISTRAICEGRPASFHAINIFDVVFIPVAKILLEKLNELLLLELLFLLLPSTPTDYRINSTACIVMNLDDFLPVTGPVSCYPSLTLLPWEYVVASSWLMTRVTPTIWKWIHVRSTRYSTAISLQSKDPLLLFQP